jgi:uncharacterized protein YcsI (UPF0317 family)
MMSQMVDIVETTTLDYDELKKASLIEVRQAIRIGAYQGHTAGLAAGYLQCNLVILPESHALDFFRFCQRNPKPCPLVGVSDTGNPMMTTLGGDINITTDIPGYIVYRDGEATDVRSNVADLWREDFVAFALGCSFTFEHALLRAGISLRHITDNVTVPMFRTNVKLNKAGPFDGHTVVSMRPIANKNLAAVTEISGKYSYAHGAPLHIGDPGDIGIKDINAPDWGNRVEVLPDETPVFWACGVTPQNVLANVKPSICITHQPGQMLITDVPEDAEIPVLSSTQT